MTTIGKSIPYGDSLRAGSNGAPAWLVTNGASMQLPILSPGSLGSLERIARIAQHERGHLIGDDEDSWYRVVRGAAWHGALMRDGRRQIVDFLLQGDLFHYQGGKASCFVLESLVDDTLALHYPGAAVAGLARTEPAVAVQFAKATADTVARLQSRLLILGRMTALEKVSGFLVEMASRSHRDSGRPVLLPMTRVDIADYLGLAVETVCRTLARLKSLGAIQLVDARHVVIVDSAALRRYWP